MTLDCYSHQFNLSVGDYLKSKKTNHMYLEGLFWHMAFLNPECPLVQWRNLVKLVEVLYHRFFPEAKENTGIADQFIQYLNQEGPFDAATMQHMTRPGTPPGRLWNLVKREAPELCQWRFTMRDNRKRLAVIVKKADKLIFISSPAAVQRHGNDTDLFEQDIAAMCEAQQEEEDEQAGVEEANSFAPQARCNADRQRYAVNAKHRLAHSRQPVHAQAAKEAHIPGVTPAPETPTWDPEGLLSRVPASGGHFARRERKQPAGGEQASPGAAYPPAGSSNAFKAQLRNHITPIAEELAQRGGIPAAERDLYDKTSLTHSLEQDYLPINMEQPGLSIQSLEPPVFTIGNFMTSEECQQLAHAAEATGLLKQSKIGEGNVESGAVSVNERRTSSTVLLEPTVVEQNAQLQPMVVELQAKAQKLLDIGGWTAAGRVPPPGQFCFESLQVACYQPTQHFLQHEDAFPPTFVKQSRFQRQATLLVYLNDVDQGGVTHFDRLGLSIKPQCGKALLFFPAFSDGTPDPRTVHTAQSPDSVKWVTQVWIAGGHPRNGPNQGMFAGTTTSPGPLASSASSSSSSSSSAAAGTDDDVESKILSTRRKKGVKGKGAKGKPLNKPVKKGFS
ncbi:hypothetical protein WJX77_004057 [Trebouxia sp. C0004]